jgi:hypothetical protein
VLITGSVERRGRYYVAEGASLDSGSDLFGGFRVCGTCGRSPSRVRVAPKGSPAQKQSYSLSRKDLLQNVHLSDGDVIQYIIIHL